MKKFAIAALLVLGACTQSTGPQFKTEKAKKDITCRSGYHIATREDGTQVCEEEGR